MNFFLADVRDGLGPCLSIYLLLIHHWDQASIGVVMGVGWTAAIVAQTPVGAVVDRTSAKRAVATAGAVTVTAAALAMPLFPRFLAISSTRRSRRLGLCSRLAAITLGSTPDQKPSSKPNDAPSPSQLTHTQHAFSRARTMATAHRNRLVTVADFAPLMLNRNRNRELAGHHTAADDRVTL